MLNKRLGKYTLGFAEPGKGKGKERSPLGSVKVGVVTLSQGHDIFTAFDRMSVSQPAAISA